MKVLYDVSVLGVGHQYPQSRTGVFRVIENVAENLALQPDCELKFCCNRDLSTLVFCLDYMNHSKKLNKVPFSKPLMLNQRLNSIAEKDALINLIGSKVPLSLVKSMQIRWKIRGLATIENIWGKFYNDTVHKKDMKEADIYHSPFYALPEQVKKSSYKSVFLTCYDLIPILFPHYFEQSILDVMKDVMKSITPETWVLCISEATRNDLLNYLGNRVNPDRVIVTELAASGTFYQSTDKAKNLETRRKHNVPDSPYILSLCTFEPRKNIDQVIKAYLQIIKQENIQDLHLVLVGSKGWKFDKIFEEIANSAALKDKIIITGFVADEDLAALYSDALFFVYPSFYEGFGLPPLEAMQCGTPVITSNTSSLPEVVGDAGIMVAPTDTDALCQAMLSLYKSPALQQQMSAKSLNRASHFSWERCGRQTVDAYAASLVK